MATQKQIEANRRNAQKSTGPKTEQGKAKSKFNALKHGMTAEVSVLPHEDAISYEDLRQATIESYQPANGAELMLVELVASNYWRLLRARRVETATLDLHIRAYKRRHRVSPAARLDDDCGIATAFADPDNGFDNINRYQITVERAYLRAVETLQKTQNARLRRERQNGFVPHPPTSRRAEPEASRMSMPSASSTADTATRLISYDRHECDRAQKTPAICARQHADDRVYGPGRVARPGA